MPLPLPQFVKQLAESGLLTADELRAIQDGLSPERLAGDDSQDFARELVRQRKLTPWQAAAIYQGKQQSLMFGNYVVLDKLGQGGMGVVFMAQHRRMKRIVALKVMSSVAMKSPDAVRRFRREVQTAAKLSHPNIVAAFDADEAHGVHFLVMEYVAGVDLASLVKKQGPLPAGQAIDCILQAARGLAYAHAVGVIHRDIKPANLLLASPPVSKGGQGGAGGAIAERGMRNAEGNEVETVERVGQSSDDLDPNHPTIKILDMGLARLTDAGTGDAAEGLTQTGNIMGTVDYMSPEQALDTKQADAQSDIYSLGCTLFYLLTGQATYSGDTVMKKLLAHREQQIPSLSAVRRDVPATLPSVFEKMVAKRMHDRYETMADVIRDLEGCLAGGVVSAAGVRLVAEILPTPSSATMGSEDPAVQDFLRAISPAASATNVRTKAGPMPASETMASRVGEHTATSGIELQKHRWHSLSKQQRRLLTGGALAGMLAVAAAIWSFSGNSPGIRPGEKSKKDPSAGTGSAPAVGESIARGETAAEQPIALASSKTFADAEFQKWVKKVALLPAEDQVREVAAKLKDLNPSFDGKVTPTIEHGVVTGLVFLTDQVTDISPVRALAELRSLTCGGSTSAKGQLADLSPLKGMQLTHLAVKCTQVADLSPLKGLPLSQLFCSYTSIVDLTPLRGMPLTHLSISGTEVSDLSPLEELRLNRLQCDETPVSDLSPLRGMTLLNLNFSNSSVSDLSPLRGMQIAELAFNNTSVSDLSPLVGMPLSFLACLTTQVPDLGALRGMQLSGIWCEVKSPGDIAILRSFTRLGHFNGSPPAVFWKRIDAEEAAFEMWRKKVTAMPPPIQVRAVADKLKDYNPGFDGNVGHTLENDTVIGLAFVSDNVTDLSPVRAIEGLQILSCPGSAPGQGKLADLWPLKGMKLAHLDVSNSAVKDLSPLKETKITDLKIGGTPVASLAPLTGTALASLACNDTRVTDLAPLAGLPLAFLDYSHVHVSDVSALKDLPLKEVRCEFKPLRDAVVLRSIASLESIDGKPAAEFWKMDDAREAAFEAWSAQVAGMPADQQARAVAAKLKELNPDFDGQFTHAIEYGAVMRFVFSADHVTDIAPVRALTGLAALECVGTGPNPGKLADLWPLKGMSLRLLNVGVTRVADLSPLRGMGLLDLTCHQTDVSDLSPLEGMPLTNLRFFGTNVSDLSPLRGMPLSGLSCHLTRVSDLSPLRESSLTFLACGGAPLNSLWPLKGMPLTFLDCSSTPITLLAPLRGMPLKTLALRSTQVTDLSPLQGMELTVLSIQACPAVRDISPLKGMPLEHLTLDFSPLRDADVLRTIKSLKMINDQPPADFWKEAGVFGKP